MKCNHTSVGMIVRKNDEILLIERKVPPFGFAPPAGHVDDKEKFEDAAVRELKEEVGLDIKSIRLLIEGRKENRCSRPKGDWHFWRIYEIEGKGEVRRSKRETKQAGWYDNEELKFLSARTESYLAGDISEDEWRDGPGIEPVWLEWFRELNIVV